MRPAPTAVLVFALQAAACVDGPGSAAAPTLDHERFAREVEPVLEARCANPSCHGADTRPLRLYAPGRFRLDPSRLHLPEALSPTELALNEASASAFAVDITAADESQLLTKSTGRATHLGGVQFPDPADREPEAIRAWLRSGGLP